MSSPTPAPAPGGLDPSLAALSLADGGGGDDNDNNTSSALLDLLERRPELFAAGVLAHLDPPARIALARTGRAFRDVMFPRSIFPSGLPRSETTTTGDGGRARINEISEFLGSVERLAWANSSGCTRVCAFAAFGGHLAVLRWAREQDPPCPWSSYTCSQAAKAGQLEALQWARAHGCDWFAYDCDYLAQCQEHHEVARWVWMQIEQGVATRPVG